MENSQIVTGDEDQSPADDAKLDSFRDSLDTEQGNDITSPGCSEQDLQCHHASVINFVHKAEEPLDFCADIGSPRSVVRVKHLRKIQTHLHRKGKPAIPSK